MMMPLETYEDLLLDRPAVSSWRVNSKSPVVLLCEHASHYIPENHHNLGLPMGSEKAHIGWDIGAFSLAERLSELLDAPLICGNYSRLMIDLNRPLHAHDSIPTSSDGHLIPGNQNLTDQARLQRQQILFNHYHEVVQGLLDQRQAAGIATRIVSIHSFTRTLGNNVRPWEVGVLYEKATDYATHVIKGLASQGYIVGDNQPYTIHPDEDMAIPVHGDGRQLPSILLEVRNDLLDDEASITAWANRLASLI